MDLRRGLGAKQKRKTGLEVELDMCLGEHDK